MNTTKKNTTEVKPAVSEEQEIKEKKCFAIMPIADHPDYDSGHFGRVYTHLIKPACERAGFKVVRADDAKASHMIMFDILKNIVECDMAICDLSSKNANVFYELGLRQAFNKKTILITDGRTNTPFDITGFRYVKYDHTLRVDSVMNDIDEISAMLSETDKASDDDVNSIVKLLKIQPAQIDKVQLNEQDSLIFSMVKQLDEKMSRIERLQKNKPLSFQTYPSGYKSLNDALLENISAREMINEIIRDKKSNIITVNIPKVVSSEKDEDKE
ncbi:MULTISPECIES: hypothetical protein [Enterobacter cloacae complex]|uniref:hypothetical protein n=1 Tax=Enterobacter cloacae complex TaxID=354276 RepID=UPI0020066F90|nr:hypothetical protein [Enterobacter roggenkampii]MCK7327015.1 hypothetical protein [Enterobacter roggenkampii]